MTTPKNDFTGWTRVGTASRIKLYLSNGTVMEADSADLYTAPAPGASGPSYKVVAVSDTREGDVFYVTCEPGTLWHTVILCGGSRGFEKFGRDVVYSTDNFRYDRWTQVVVIHNTEDK